LKIFDYYYIKQVLTTLPPPPPIGPRNIIFF
jgi:hypothetical protein